MKLASLPPTNRVEVASGGDDDSNSGSRVTSKKWWWVHRILVMMCVVNIYHLTCTTLLDKNNEGGIKIIDYILEKIETPSPAPPTLPKGINYNFEPDVIFSYYKDMSIIGLYNCDIVAMNVDVVDKNSGGSDQKQEEGEFLCINKLVLLFIVVVYC